MSRDEVRAFDAWAIKQLGIPGAALMENAGRNCAEIIIQKLSGKPNAKICIFCGAGNNGGDGFVIARHLLNKNKSVVIVLCGDKDKFKGEAKVNFDIARRLGIGIEELNFNYIESIRETAGKADLIVDAIFGTGLSGELKEEYKRLIEAINGLNKPVLAVDIPSGLDCDTGKPLGAAIRAKWTVTLVDIKKGFAEKGAKEYTGEVITASIGIEPKFKN